MSIDMIFHVKSHPNASGTSDFRAARRPVLVSVPLTAVEKGYDRPH